MDSDKFLKVLLGSEYYTLQDLRYNQKLGIMLSKDELEKYLDMKDELVDEDYEFIKRLPLKTFNSKYCFYVKSEYLVNKIKNYLDTLVEDFETNSENFLTRNIDDIMMSKIFSEVEGTLNIENIPTTHKRIREVFNAEKLTDKNDIIIKNMQNAISYITTEKPAFNKENLFKLYNYLSKDCLDEDDRIKQGFYYRDDIVSVGGFEGAPANKIEECMDSLFEFASDKQNIEKYNILLPHICHYYILYVHPYFDYNGRTARMVAFWLNSINNLLIAPYFMSEAINENKKEYYKALTNTRITNNDLTYFLGYILDSAIKFNYVYKNLEEIRKMLSKSGDFLTSTELTYLKKIIVHSSENYFNYKMFFEYINGTMSKQAGLKILNRLTDYGILIKDTNKKKESIYKVNQQFITYKLN